MEGQKPGDAVREARVALTGWCGALVTSAFAEFPAPRPLVSPSTSPPYHFHECSSRADEPSKGEK
jgi:hypothetical protein